MTVLAPLATTAGLTLAALWYVRGEARRPAPLREPVAFGAGLLVLAVALAGPLDGAADRSFTGHMAQHLLLLAVAPPLLVIGRPSIRFHRVGGPLTARWWRRSLPLRRTGRSVAVGWAVLAVTVWTWHAPVLYDLAVRQPLVHGVEHATMLGAGLLFWTGIGTALRRGQHGGAALALATTGLHTGTLGALLVFSDQVLVPSYAASSIDVALADQQRAGLVMWILASPITLGAVLLVVHRLLAAAEVSAPWTLEQDRMHTDRRGADGGFAGRAGHTSPAASSPALAPGARPRTGAAAR